MTTKRVAMPHFVWCALVLILSFIGITKAWRTGKARLLVREANQSLMQTPADRASRLSPEDPESHATRALVLYQSDDLTGCIAELERAVALRPEDYLLWLQIGRARDEAGNTRGALLALQRAIELAPYYSDPRWQYGNVLYRAGRLPEAFDQLRTATRSDPSLAPALTDLVWGTYPGDAKAVERIVSPVSDEQRISLARYFVKKGLTDEAMSVFRSAVQHRYEESSRLVSDLTQAKQFRAAFEVWSAIQPNSGEAPAGAIADPGFEKPLNIDAKGFSWRQEHALQGVKLSLDNRHPNSGSNSLSIEWNGHGTPEASVISQLVLVQPGSRYRLGFFVRTEDVITGGLPLIAVTDANVERTLALSKPFAEGTSNWQHYEVEFETAATTDAVEISVRRQACADNPCPMFGRVWLDDFALRKP